MTKKDKRKTSEPTCEQLKQAFAKALGEQFKKWPGDEEKKAEATKIALEAFDKWCNGFLHA